MKAITTAIFSTILSTASATEQNVETPYYCGSELPKIAENIENIVPTLYKIVSGAADEKRNWSLMKTLLAPNAVITPIFHDKDGNPVIESLSVDDFIALNEKVFKGVSFYETEVSNQTTVIGHMATVISKYESRDAIKAQPYSTGVNSFQLAHDGRRWCVISATWDSDKGGHRID